MPSPPDTQGRKCIFISYRREDSQDITGRIYDRLTQKFGSKSIFKDVDAIPFGVDFREHLEQQVADCQVLLVIIGASWIANERLKDEKDFVRIEIEYGLNPDRQIRVIPVLVGNASIPTAEQLPPSLKDLTYRNAIQVRPDPDFHRDMDKLISSLADVVGLEDKPLPPRPNFSPYRIAGSEIADPKVLAETFINNWSLGVSQFKRGFVTKWFEEEYRDQGIAGHLMDIGDDNVLNDSEKLSMALMVIDENLPLYLEGEEISPEWMAAHPDQTLKILEGKLLWYMKEFHLGFQYTDQLDFLEKGRTKIGELNVPADLESVDKLLVECFNDPDDFKDRVQKFCESHRFARDERIDDLLKQQEISLHEAAALLACDPNIFLTPEQKQQNDGKTHLKEFQVPMDWDLAEKLIEANNWDEVNPYLQEALERPSSELSDNLRLEKIYYSSEREYWDAVALIAALSSKAKHYEHKKSEVVVDISKPPLLGESVPRAASSPNEPNAPDQNYLKIGAIGILIAFICIIGFAIAKPFLTNKAPTGVPAVTAEPINTIKAGTLLWEFETEGFVESSPAIGSDGTVYVGSNDNKLYALSGKSGVKLWEFKTESNLHSSPAIGSDGTVYVGSYDNKLYALSGKSGVKLWEFETGGSVISSPAIGSDGTVYVGSNDNKLYALSGKSGVKLWEFETGGSVISSPAIGSDGTVYVGSNDNKLYALSGKSGVKLWEFETGGSVPSSPAIGSDGTVYVGSNDNKLYALSGKSGVKLWEFKTESNLHSSPAIGSDGTVYVGSYDNKLYAINTDSRGLAKSPWPMRGQNAQHTGRVMK